MNNYLEGYSNYTCIGGYKLIWKKTGRVIAILNDSQAEAMFSKLMARSIIRGSSRSSYEGPFGLVTNGRMVLK